MTTRKVIIPPVRDAVLQKDPMTGKDSHTTAWRRFHELATEQLNETAAQADTSTEGLADAAPYLNLIGSFVEGCTITGHDNGVDATITVSTHFRNYHAGAVSVTTGTVHAAWATNAWVYYDDPTHTGGAVTYLAATFYGDAFTSATNPNRHFVGSILAPASGAGDTAGKPVRPPGYNEP